MRCFPDGLWADPVPGARRELHFWHAYTSLCILPIVERF